MSLLHTVLRQYRDTSAVAIQFSEQITGNAELNFDQDVPIATNTQYAISFTRANLKSLCIYAADAVTIKTNSTGSPQETITLVAGQTLVWTLATDGLAKCPFAGNVTTMYITNATAAAVAVKIRGLLNQ